MIRSSGQLHRVIGGVTPPSELLEPPHTALADQPMGSCSATSCSTGKVYLPESAADPEVHRADERWMSCRVKVGGSASEPRQVASPSASDHEECGLPEGQAAGPTTGIDTALAR